MWRNFGWTAILATWTILLILNSGLAGERASNNPRVNNEHTSREADRGAKFHAPDRWITDDFTLRYARGNRKSSDRAPMRNAKAVSLEFKNTENRDSRVGGHEKSVATSGAMTYSDDRNAVRLSAERITTENARLSKMIHAEQSRGAEDYRELVSRSHQEDAKKRRDIRNTLDERSRNKRKQHRDGRIFGRENGTIAFAKRSHVGRDSSTRKFENSGVRKFATTVATKSERAENERRVRNGSRDNARRSPELMENGANKLIQVQGNDHGSRTSSTSLPNCSTSKETRSNGAVTVADAVANGRVAVNTPRERFVAVGRTALIRTSGISGENGGNADDGENTLRLPKDERSEFHKAKEFPADETYKRDDAACSKAGFKANAMTRVDEGGNEDVEDPFAFRAVKPLDDHLAGNGVSFTQRPLAREKRSALRRTTSDTTGPQHRYRSFTSNIGTEIGGGAGVTPGRVRGRKGRRREKKSIVGARDATRDPLGGERDPWSISSFAESIDESKPSQPTSARIPVTPAENPTHVQHVRSRADREHPRTTNPGAGIRGAPRIGLRNVSSSATAKLEGQLPFESERARHSRKSAAIDLRTWLWCTAELADGRSRDLGEHRRGTFARGESATSIADGSNLRNVGATTDRSGDHRAATRDSKIRESRCRRRKRREVRDISGSSMSIALNSETQGTPDKGMTISAASTIASQSVSSTRTSSTDEISVSTGGSLATVETLPSSRYRDSREESTDHEQYANALDSATPQVPLTDTPKMSTASMMEAPAFLIKTLDRSTTITDSFDIGRGIPSTSTDADILDITSETMLHVSPIESIGSPGGREMYPSERSVSTVDPLPRGNADNPFRNVLENVDDSSASLDQWPVKHSAVVEGDLVLGGLMMVHEREDTVTCGPVMPQGGIQALEAMLYTLDILNDREIVPGVKIGAHILDDCDKDTYGLEMAVDFIKGSISNIDGAEYHCNKTAVRKVISGVVGAASSVTSIQVANLLRLFKIPQVSFFSTSPELSNKQRFEYFTRTIPSDHYQVKAMVDIVLTMGWSYVSIIYEESNYGIKAFEELEELLGKHNICIAVKEKLVKDSGVAEETAYDNIVSKLLTKPRAKGCIIFGSDQEVAGVMRAVRRCNATGAFSWIGSDGWSARGLVSNDNEPEVEGTLSVQPQANPVKGFEEYFLNLTVENNRRNPWFVEFWEDHFKCRYPNSSRTPYNKKYTKPCTTKQRLTKQDTAFEDQLQFVSDAVMAFAYAFRDMHQDLCHGKAGLCDAMKPTKGTKLLQYLRKVDFEGLSGDKFKFDKNGDGPARYNIIHFKQISAKKYKWVRVGKYLEGELRLNMSEIQFKLGHPQPPESVCSLPCELGQAKKYVEGERCCWHCFNCTQYQIRHPKDETQCIQCRRGTLPDETHSTCRDIPEEFLRPESGWAIGAMSLSASGILVTLFVCGVFLRHNDTPVVRASGRELSYVLLLGILLCYLVTFTLVLKPTNVVCSIQRFAAGFCFTVVYAALLTKTNRISRIFRAGSAKRPSFISPRSQLIICCGLIFVQILINAIWMIIDPARAMHHYPMMEDNLLVCNNYIDASYMIAFAFPTVLIVVCTVYAILTRKIPEAFNESKHIGLTMYTTCVIWCAFVPLYYGTGSNIALRITSMSVTISLSASVTLICLFSPKLYIILIRPERNVRPTVRAGRPNQTRSSAITATNASMMGPVTATTVLTAATCDQNKALNKHIASTIDCSTQSECYELELKDQKNGKPPATCTSRSTQTTNKDEEHHVVTSNKESPDVIASASNKESKSNTTTTTTTTAPTKRLNSNARIGNGPLSQSDVSL